MRKAICVFLMAVFSTRAFPQFASDLPFTKVLKELGVITLSDLGVGESGFIQSWSGVCKLPNGHIGLTRYTKLETDRSKYLSYLKVTRQPHGKVSLTMAEAEPRTGAGIRLSGGLGEDGRLSSLTLVIASADSCKNRVFIPGDDEEFFVVDSIEGANSISALIEIVKKKRTGETETASESKVGSSQIENELIQTWMTIEDRSKIDDSPIVTMMLSSNESIQGSFGQASKPVFILRCREKKTDAYITTGTMLDDEAVIIRLDADKAYKERMSKSTDGQALFFSNAISSIKKFGKYKIMTFRFTPYRSGSQTVTFNIEGLEREVVPLRKACQW